MSYVLHHLSHLAHISYDPQTHKHFRRMDNSTKTDFLTESLSTHSAIWEKFKDSNCRKTVLE